MIKTFEQFDNLNESKGFRKTYGVFVYLDGVMTNAYRCKSIDDAFDRARFLSVYIVCANSADGRFNDSELEEERLDDGGIIYTFRNINIPDWKCRKGQIFVFPFDNYDEDFNKLYELVIDKLNKHLIK
jgi:hypothetical protein